MPWWSTSKVTPRSVGPGEVDRQAVVDVDQRYPFAVDEDSVGRIVVAGDPVALFKAQQQMGTAHPRMRDPQVGAQVTAHDHVTTRQKAALNGSSPNGQRRLLSSGHQFTLDRSRQCRFSRIRHHTMPENTTDSTASIAMSNSHTPLVWVQWLSSGLSEPGTSSRRFTVAADAA